MPKITNTTLFKPEEIKKYKFWGPLLAMSPSQVHWLLINELVDIDVVRKLPEWKFKEIFPNTQATQSGYLKERPPSQNGTKSKEDNPEDNKQLLKRRS